MLLSDIKPIISLLETIERLPFIKIEFGYYNHWASIKILGDSNSYDVTIFDSIICLEKEKYSSGTGTMTVDEAIIKLNKIIEKTDENIKSFDDAIRAQCKRQYNWYIGMGVPSDRAIKNTCDDFTLEEKLVKKILYV